MSVSTIVVACLFLVFATLTVINGYPLNNRGVELVGEVNDNQFPETTAREERILGILGSWGFGYPGFGAGAYGGLCRLTGRCKGNTPWNLKMANP